MRRYDIIRKIEELKEKVPKDFEEVFEFENFDIEILNKQIFYLFLRKKSGYVFAEYIHKDLEVFNQNYFDKKIEEIYNCLNEILSTF